MAARVGLTIVLGLLLWAHAPPLVLGWEATVVLGNSMRPKLLPGDVVLYQPLHGRRPQGGQVVVATDPARPPRLLIHRVAKVLRNGDVITAGDHNGRVDSTPVPPSSVLGLGRLRIPSLGLVVSSWRQGEIGRLIALAVVTGVTVRLAAMPLPAQDGTEAAAAADP
ncbi:signal peptidase I [Streptomyces sp. NPDC049687]|uniref:signal peptidase I n=1 Tax=Streptomyces sp. NPDC049687 TaxID=3365596 RepID=UPI00378F470C